MENLSEITSKRHYSRHYCKYLQKPYNMNTEYIQLSGAPKSRANGRGSCHLCVKTIKKLLLGVKR